MQIDFGEQWMDTYTGSRIKVYFIAVVLSCSRFKWGKFTNHPFTSSFLIQCLDECFAFLGGAAKELVFDQDGVLAVSENCGDIIYTHEFEAYRSRNNFNIYLCRGADPESKGKIENVVKYFKHNFLDNRKYTGTDSLNEAFYAWLTRTGNSKVNGSTQLIPAVEFETEQKYLRPVAAWNVPEPDSILHRKVRKDNTVLYGSNFYSVPLGTYNKIKEVSIEIDLETLIIRDESGDQEIASHRLSPGKGKVIKAKDHCRNKEAGIPEFHDRLSKKLLEICDHFLDEVRMRKPRYVRDQYSMIERLISEHGVGPVIEGVEYCEEHEIYSATELKDTVCYFKERKKPKQETPVKAVIRSIAGAAYGALTTQKRPLDEYEFGGGRK